MFVTAIIEKHKAEELLSLTNSIWPARRKIIKVELFYLPLYLFTIDLEDKKGRQYQEMISVDGIKGEFAFFRETEYDQPAKEKINKFSCKLTESMARQIAMEEYKRFMLKNNLKSGNHSRIVIFSQGVQVFYPYWIGYIKRRNGYDFEVIDAVGGSKQGIKMRPVFIDLILQTSADKKEC
jgi:hypothetical protein